ncbi:ATP-binding cassette domain-containing protein [Salinimonas sp. HHU 13199]|uniref:ATP-binding cassette domain-containing protein n=1 Tax=Salinimonas profundi TaxID=2729140 RepID=A0ABR8LH32_9ALTE|nr:ATP-binding cassette domain-containing protein [Salinimonas profundi]MBD3585565.1 ATP-binding cassette domain-containing protein [Salinimonas profundi]
MKTPWITLLLAIAHGVTGLLILIISAWFIAACAIAPVGFNYMLPAVIIRALALLRIASGYGHMWAGHRDLLMRTAWLRHQLFRRLANHRIQRKAQLADALSAHTETLAAVWIACISQLATALLLLPVLLIAGVFIALPGTTWFAVLGIGWLIISGWVVIKSLAIAAEQVVAQTALSEQSEAYLRCSALWHLFEQAQHQRPSARPVWSLEAGLHTLAQQAVWCLQGLCFVMIGVYIWKAGAEVYANPMAMIVPLVLFAAPEWLGRASSALTFAARYHNAQEAVTSLTMRKVSIQPEASGCIRLKHFSAVGRNVQPVTAVFPAHGIVTLRGASGVGKSSLLQAIAGDIPFRGNKYCGAKALQPGLIRNWMYLEQTPVVLQATLRENLAPAGAVADQEIRQVLSKLGLSYMTNLGEWLGAGGRALSGGEQKRIAIGRALLAEKDVLLIDEPFEGLDIFTCKTLAHLFNDAARSKLLVIATHCYIPQLRIDTSIALHQADLPDKNYEHA